MLLNQDSTYFDEVRDRRELVFPRGWLDDGFRPLSPSPTVLRQLIADPALVGGDVMLNLGTDVGARAINKLDVLVGLRVRDWYDAGRRRLYNIATKIGLLDDQAITALGATANVLVGSLIDIMSAEQPALAEEIGQNAAFSFHRMVSALPELSATMSLASSYIALAMQIVDVVGNLVASKTGASERLPLAA